MKHLEKIPNLIRIFFTFMFVNAAWVLFRSPTFDIALTVLKNMFAPESFSFSGIAHMAYNTSITYPDSMAVIYVLAILSILTTLVFLYPKNSIDKYNEFKPTVKNRDDYCLAVHGVGYSFLESRCVYLFQLLAYE
jgi:hypothetical protein